ncbi:MAG: hypothetical protein QRY74_06155 [Chlamydia sp.]
MTPLFSLRLSLFIFLCHFQLLSSLEMPKPGASNIGALQIRLNQPNFSNGVLTTASGGIITGKELYIQAKKIVYTKKSVHEAVVHTIDAEDDIHLVYKNKSYKASKAHIDLLSNTAVLWNGCTKSGEWYVGGEEIQISQNGTLTLQPAYLSTSENERSDWSIEAQNLTIYPEESIQAKNVSFQFEKIPLFWLPNYRKSLLDSKATPFHYRVRHEGLIGTIFEMRYDFPSTGYWTNQGVVNCSLKHGLGLGLVTEYRSKKSPAHFQANSFIAPSTDLKKPRYRFQGLYENYYTSSNIHVRAIYDKLHNLKTKKLFPTHSIKHTRQGTAQIEIWRKEADWIGRVNSRIRIDSFQTVKEELPLCTFHQKPYLISPFSWFLENRISAGFLQYKYAKRVHSAHNFASMRSEISQKIFKTFTLSPYVIAPSIGYRALYYSSSPKGGQKVQFLGEASCTVKTRFIKPSKGSFQTVEPYYTIQSIVCPSLKSKKTYIFDIEDGFAGHTENRIGMRHSFLESLDSASPRIFQKKFFTDIYTRSYFGTKNLSSYPTKIWIETLFDATPQSSYSMQFGYDFRHQLIDHCNLETRYTLSQKTAFAFEYRSRSKYHWRKLDNENFNIDAAYSEKALCKAHMSDARKSFISSFFWTAAPDLNLEFKSTIGFRSKFLRHYHDIEFSLLTLVRGALHVKCSYGIRSGSQHRWTLSLHLGGKKSSSSTGFHKIGQGNYDIR